MSRARQANDRAADWLIRREDGDWSDADQQDFDAWLAESPGNRAAYLRLRHSWRQADRIGALGSGEIAQAEPAPRWAGWRRPLALAASLVAVVGLSVGGMMLAPRGPTPDTVVAVAPESYGTPLGGRKQIGLADGSRIELNTATKIRAKISDEGREVWLDKGEAYFEVAHLNGRKFVVHAGNRTVTVLGTKFAVRREKAKVVVSVLEGRVRVADNDNAFVPAAIITAGDVAVAQGPSALFTEKSRDRVENALAWRDGMLKFDQQPLPLVAAEFNRYNPRPIVVRDDRAAEIRISGAFPASDPQAFARLLRDAFGLRVDMRDDKIIISG